jgi:beta-lactamase regulating signal transducer with metallopeptidase domain
MTPTTIRFVDQTALLLWFACLHTGLVGAALLVPIAVWHRRPAVRHFLAVSTLVAALVSPLTAALAMRLGLDWTPIPRKLHLVLGPSLEPVANDQYDLSQKSVQSRQELTLAPEAPKDVDELRDSQQRSTEPQSDRAQSGALDSAATPLSGAARRSNDPVTTQTAAGSAPPSVPAVASPQAASPRGPSTAAANPVTLRAGFTIWLAGVLVISIRVVMTRAQLHRLIDVARPVCDLRVAALVERVSGDLKLALAPELLASDLVSNPFVAGVRRSRVVVPEWLLATDRESELVHTLVHEFSHIARGDLWIGWIQGGTKTIFWPNPFVHVHAAILAQAREDLCDNCVLISASPTAYARTLLNLSERLSAISAAPAATLFYRRHSLANRISGLLNPRRDRALGLGRPLQVMLASLAFLLATSAAGVGGHGSNQKDAADLTNKGEASQIPASVPSADVIVRELAAHATDWIVPAKAIEHLEYELVSASRVSSIKVKQGEQRPVSAWIGATLQSGFWELMHSPERFRVEARPVPAAGTVTLVARPKDENAYVRVEVGNGVENSWSGYFSHGARETTLLVDATRMLPLEEQTGSATFRFSEWQETSAGKWIPRRIDVVGASSHYRMHFGWLADKLWLLRASESITPEGTVALTHTRSVKINGKDVATPIAATQGQSREAMQELLAMIDHNRPWLDSGPTGSGWRTPFQTLSYSFHTIREDIREICSFDRNGTAVFEVAHDGRGKMKDQVGNRTIALNSRQHASSRRHARFARIHARPEREREQSYDLALKQYARIGCQFDLPLFRYRDQLEFATISIEDGRWAGEQCRVATVSNTGGGAHLGCGTMLAFTSWSYVHHIAPSKEVLYIEPRRNIPIRETLVSSRDQQTFEIDFGDYVEVEANQWAPRSIRIESKDYFRCEYHFQVVAGTHWMLEDIVSWFKPDEKSKGVVEDVRVNGGQELLDEALQQVEATRIQFGGALQPNQRINVATVPFALGRPLHSESYEFFVTLSDGNDVVVSARANDLKLPQSVPLCFLDARGRLLFAASVSLQEQNGAKRGSVTFRGSQAWRAVQSIALPITNADSQSVPMNVIPIRWGEFIPVNIPDAREGESEGSRNKPRDARTRGWRIRVDRTVDNKAELTLDLVSVDGPQEFILDLSAAILAESGELAACGHLSTSLKVVSDPVEQRFVISLGTIRADVQPKYVAVGIAPGDVTSAPVGSRWGMFVRNIRPFDIAVMLAAPDDGCRRGGLSALDDSQLERTIVAEFTGDRTDNRRIGNGPYSRRAVLAPHAQVLDEILKTTRAADVKAAAARLLAYSEATGAINVIEPLITDPASLVRDAAAIGLTFLERPGYLPALRSILARQAPSIEKTERADIEAWRAFDRLEHDALFALTHQHSNEAVDLLGETLMADLDALRPEKTPEGRGGLQGRSERAILLCTLLGRTGNDRAVRWLVAAADLIAKRVDLAANFDQEELTRAMLRFKDQSKGRIALELEKSSQAGIWARAIRDSSDPFFVEPVRAMLRRHKVESSAAYAGVLYLWNVNSAEALEGLRESYNRGLLRDQPRLRMRLCEALAARGDGRGLSDAYEVLVGMERPSQQPAEEKARNDWQRQREDQQREAEAVFGRASRQIFAEFLVRKTESAAPEERRVALRLLWKLLEVPKPFAAVIPVWAQDSDRQVAELAKRLLARD